MKLFNEVKQALIDIENKLSKEKDSNLVIELICKNKTTEENIEGYNIQQISGIGCENITKDINIVNSMLRTDK